MYANVCTFNVKFVFPSKPDSMSPSPTVILVFIEGLILGLR